MAGSESTLTPMMAQYRRIKSELPKDALLLFRLGDFYEMFFEDAQQGAQLLNVALTSRNGIPMCGIPHHAVNSYVGRLLKAGRKVALCDQTEEAKPGKLVQREVTSILSPGTHLDDRLLVADRNNFLAAIHSVGAAFGLTVVDLSTGDFRVTEIGDERAVLGELDRLRPAELLVPVGNASLRRLLGVGEETVDITGPLGRLSAGGIVIGYDDWTFQAETAPFTLKEHFKVVTLDGFGLRDRLAATGAAGAALHYLGQHLRRDLAHLTRLTFYQVTDYLVLDQICLRNLEILEPLHADSARATTLFGAMNRTVTPMGGRRLRDWLTQPLASVDRIRARQDAIEVWMRSGHPLDEFRTDLREMRDLERTLGRISLGSGNARDLVSLRDALLRIPGLRQSLESTIDSDPDRAGLLRDLASGLQPLPELLDLLERAVVDEPSLALKEGGIIREGYSPELDEIRGAASGGKEWLAKLQQDEITRTGIPNLKVGFNSVFGYFLEVTKTHLSKVPADYIRKQTVASGERFITQELKAMEQKILGAEDLGSKLEYELFLELRERVLASLKICQDTADAASQLDVLASFADVARLRGHCRPDVADEGVIDIREGRHPVLEIVSQAERFVPNDCQLDWVTRQIMIITGPNMAGKSTYIRQTALLAILAHTGAFLPAASARVDLMDRVFTRIGASDDLARGQSTFMVEMSETANILNNATRRSFVILDEIGRGTSTFDGLSLAWSIVEHLHHQVGAKTLFATHYHELTELGGSELGSKTQSGCRLARVTNHHVAVREWNEQIIFLRKVLPGGTDKSYGIQVGRLAGVPRPVIDRAKTILRILEDTELNLQAVMGGAPEGNAAFSKPIVNRPKRSSDRDRLRVLQPSEQFDLFRDLTKGGSVPDSGQAGSP
jgi:DNA mismatch repair protein MutS